MNENEYFLAIHHRLNHDHTHTLTPKLSRLTIEARPQSFPLPGGRDQRV